MLTDTMRRIASMTAASAMLMLPCVAALAQSATGVPAGAQHQSSDPYKLTPAQQSQMRAITESAKQKIEAIQSNASLSRHDKSAQISKLMDTLEAQTKAIFNAQQLKVYEDRKQQSMHYDPLHLTSQQTAEIYLIKGDTDRQTSAVFANARLSRSEKARQLEKILNDSKHDEIAILTPAQVKAVEANDAKNDAADPIHRTLQQKIEMRIIEREAMDKAQLIVNDKSLSTAQKKAKIEALRQSAQKEQEAVLTSKQRAILVAASQKQQH